MTSPLRKYHLNERVLAPVPHPSSSTETPCSGTILQPLLRAPDTYLIEIDRFATPWITTGNPLVVRAHTSELKPHTPPHTALGDFFGIDPEDEPPRYIMPAFSDADLDRMDDDLDNYHMRM